MANAVRVIQTYPKRRNFKNNRKIYKYETTYYIIIFLFTAFSYGQFADGDILIDLGVDGVKSHTLVDLDNDSDLDLLKISASKIVWHENEGDDSFAASETLILDGISGQSNLFTSDFNGDGYMDFTAFYSGQISLFINNTDGTFTPTELASSISIGDRHANYTVFDDNGDGYLDVFYIDINTGVVKIPGEVGGTFGSPIPLHDDAYNYYSIHQTDFNNDGDTDLLFSTEDPSIKVTLLENLGSGVYDDSTILLDDLVRRIIYIEFADMDLDGDDDWVLGSNYEFHTIEYFENLGGSLDEPTVLTSISGSDAAIGDIDLDGYPDIVCGGETKSHHMWIHNNGDGTFEEGDELPVDIFADTGWLDALSDVVLVDSDGDGDLDIYVEAVQDMIYYYRYENYTINDFNATGHFYADLNENGAWDDDEFGINFPEINADPIPEVSYVDPDGNYFVGYEPSESVTSTISPILPENWAISSTDASYTVTIDGVSTWEDLDFGIYPTVLIDSIGNSLVGAFPRCNDTVNYWITTNNLGTTITSGIIDLELDAAISFVSSEIAPDSIVGQHVYWHYDDLTWLNSEMIQLQVALPDFMSEGDTLTSALTTTVDTDDATVYTAHNSLDQILVCAYDPNDKLALPMGIDELGFISDETEWIEYTVRFQNTGSDTAFNVVIKDQLDDNFDWSTLETLGSSHEMIYAIDDMGKITFSFNDIALPDSTTNVTASQGFVSYKVKLNEELPVATSIENRADIYFDLNPSISTNTTIQTLFNCETILENVTLPSSICAGETVMGTTDGFLVPSNTVYNWNALAEDYVGDEIELSFTESGSFPVIVTASTSFCEASETFMIDVSPDIPETILPTVSICEGDSLMIFGNYESTSATYSTTYSSLSGCDSIVTVELMVLALPLVEFESPALTEVCFYADPIALNAIPVGGVFEGEGITDNTFDPYVTGQGTFTLHYTYENDNDCAGADSITIHVVDCLSLTENKLNSVEIYPNPFSDFTTVYIKGIDHEKFDLIVYDLLGQEMMRKSNISTEKFIIDAKNWETGVYTVAITGESEILWSDRLIVK